MLQLMHLLLGHGQWPFTTKQNTNKLTRHGQLKSREMQLLASQECIWHCIHAPVAVKTQCMPNQCLQSVDILFLLLTYWYSISSDAINTASNLCCYKSQITNQLLSYKQPVE